MLRESSVSRRRDSRGLWLERGELPAVGRELTRDGDRDHGAALAALLVEALPALVEAALAAPGGVDRAWVVAALAAFEGAAIRGGRR